MDIPKALADIRMSVNVILWSKLVGIARGPCEGGT